MGTAAPLSDALPSRFLKQFNRRKTPVSKMLELAFGALIIAAIAGGLGFSGVAAAASTVAKVTFGLFLVLALILFSLVLLGVGALA